MSSEAFFQQARTHGPEKEASILAGWRESANGYSGAETLRKPVFWPVAAFLAYPIVARLVVELILVIFPIAKKIAPLDENAPLEKEVLSKLKK